MAALPSKPISLPMKAALLECFRDATRLVPLELRPQFILIVSRFPPPDCSHDFFFEVAEPKVAPNHHLAVESSCIKQDLSTSS
jgi:hypothetical protein